MWKDLQELESPGAELKKFVDQHFSPEDSPLIDPVTRREFIRLMAASLAFGGLSACVRMPLQRIFSYVTGANPDTDWRPGDRVQFATSLLQDGYAMGILATSFDGRPIKIDGNPLHPQSLGACDPQSQASILSLYDPDRLKKFRSNGIDIDRESLGRALRSRALVHLKDKGQGLRILSGRVSSLSQLKLLSELLSTYPKAQWISYEASYSSNALQASEWIFKQKTELSFDLRKADVIFSLGHDFLGQGPARLRLSREFSERRKPASTMNRLYVAEACPTLTGSMADHHWALESDKLSRWLVELASELNLLSTKVVIDKRIKTMAGDLKQAAGRSLVCVHGSSPLWMQALCLAINVKLGNLGQTLHARAAEDFETKVGGAEALEDLMSQMKSKEVETLLLFDSNPVYSAPQSLDFANALNSVPYSFGLASHASETVTLCRTQIPLLHELETWTDSRSVDLKVTYGQPLLSPLYDGMTSVEVLDSFLRDSPRSAYDIVRDHAPRISAVDFEKTWQEALEKGFIEDSVAKSLATPSLQAEIQYLGKINASIPSLDTLKEGSLELWIEAHPYVGDGKNANNGWLQELAEPLSKLTWGNALFMAPTTAKLRGLTTGDHVEVTVDSQKIVAPVLLLPGMAERAMKIQTGYGRALCGHVGAHVGVSATALQSITEPFLRKLVSLKKVLGHTDLACTQSHHSMEGRDLVRVANSNTQLARNSKNSDATFFPTAPLPENKEPYAWGMTIDLNSCIGCNACLIGCQSENNIPVVGKEQVLKSREMNWIRVDRYYEGTATNPQTYFQPVPCMHCENAPCEVVCPVGATVHDTEGINEMVYNRCVGTRYCSNNCPYKVRRFNFLQYSQESDLDKMFANPDVSVRSRGVMEKCTYCIQRIESARITSIKEKRQIRDGEITTACQQVCPTQAIAFGNIKDPNSQVSQLKESPRNYGLLEETGTRPRTTYLTRLQNPNPEISDGTS